MGHVHVHGTPEDARVVIDDVFIGTLKSISAAPLELRTGPHVISIESTGFFPYDVSLAVKQTPVDVPVALQRMPKE
jgi:hypothetical protein